MASEPVEGFVPGKRAHGECPKHPGEPYYHCPQCAKERQQAVGHKIAEDLRQQSPAAESGTDLTADPLPVRITHRAASRLIADLNHFRRNRVESQVQLLRDRAASIPASEPEGEVTRNRLAKLEASLVNGEVESFDVLVQVFLDVTGVSGIHPKIELCEPAKVLDFEKDYRVYTYSGGLRVAVELRHMNYLRGLIIDWHDRLDREGYVLRHMKGDWRVENR